MCFPNTLRSIILELLLSPWYLHCHAVTVTAGTVENWSVNHFLVFFFASLFSQIASSYCCVTGNTRPEKVATRTGCQWQPPIHMLKVYMKGICVYTVMRVECNVTINFVKGWSDIEQVSPVYGSLLPNSLPIPLYVVCSHFSLTSDLAVAKLQEKLIQLAGMSEN